MPVLRGPIVLAEAFALLPMVRRAIPQARFPFERRACWRRSSAPRSPRGLFAVAPFGRVEGASRRRRRIPARRLGAARPDLAAYHGAEHISIGTYENGGERAPKEHPRCGSQLIAPMVASSLAVNVSPRRRRQARGNWLASSGRPERSAALWRSSRGSPGTRRTRSRARLRVPGFELQRHLSTAEPSDDQLEVANAAREACLALERAQRA
jgi:hypothetical protein